MRRSLAFLVIITALWCSPIWVRTTTGSEFGSVVHLRDSSSHHEPQVEVYMTSWCPWCKKTLTFFRSRGIAVQVYDIERDSAAARRKKRIDSSRGVPTTVIDGRVIHGYAPKAFERALKYSN